MNNIAREEEDFESIPMPTPTTYEKKTVSSDEQKRNTSFHSVIKEMVSKKMSSTRSPSPSPCPSMTSSMVPSTTTDKVSIGTLNNPDHKATYLNDVGTVLIGTLDNPDLKTTYRSTSAFSSIKSQKEEEDIPKPCKDCGYALDHDSSCSSGSSEKRDLGDVSRFLPGYNENCDECGYYVGMHKLECSKRIYGRIRSSPPSCDECGASRGEHRSTCLKQHRCKKCGYAFGHSMLCETVEVKEPQVHEERKKEKKEKRVSKYLTALDNPINEQVTFNILVRAVRHASLDTIQEVLEEIVERWIDENETTIDWFSWSILLEAAAKRGSVSVLNRLFYIQRWNPNENTEFVCFTGIEQHDMVGAMNVACEKGFDKIVKYLVLNGASMAPYDVERWCLCALKNGHVSIAAYLGKYL
jgi:hypothetical protein